MGHQMTVILHEWQTGQSGNAATATDRISFSGEFRTEAHSIHYDNIRMADPALMGAFFTPVQNIWALTAPLFPDQPGHVSNGHGRGSACRHIMMQTTTLFIPTGCAWK
ncbi:MAG: hypothetical protein R2861_16640 [Desulfobacterales bacterium]